MGRERPGYRAALERLSERFPDREGISVEECAKILGVHPQTITDNRKNGIPIKKIGRKNLIILTELANFMAN